jgi:tRNA pseudouridine synthase 10
LLEDEELAVVQDCVKPRTQKNNILSRHCVESLLESMPDEDFNKLVRIPPGIPLYEVTFKEMKFFSEAIHLVGNYCKYSRELYQIPFVVDGKIVNGYSIENIILEALKKVVSFKGMVFLASSFDDASFRVLGKGRTFYLQIQDAKVDSISHQQCRTIERIINAAKGLRVKNLKQADKKDIMVTMESEQQNPRSYKLLCIVYKCKNVDYCVNAVNMYSKISIQQKTPVRVLHQNRPYNSKEKKIYYIKATKIKNNLLEIELCAECGLSVGEFVNGDFGRTNPSLCDIMKAKVELLAVDVVDFQSTLACAAEEEDVEI